MSNGFRELSPTKQKKNKKRIWGFDIETYDNNKKFLLASVWSSDTLYKLYYSKNAFIRDLIGGKFNGSIIVATNLTFDFFGTFFEGGSKGFDFIFRGSEMIYAKTYIYNQKLNRKSNHHKTCVTFLDTLNYAKMSVEKLGKLIGVPKMKSPEFIGLYPKISTEWLEMIKYNINDSKVSCLGLKYLYVSFEKLGASPKLTLASTSMSLFRNRYLKESYYRHDENVLMDIFEGYYGGRTEAFSRGEITKYFYWDFNSLYPSQMLKEFPDPNTLRTNKLNRLDDIKNYEGMSNVTIHCPKMKYPLLPIRFEGKLIFPYGTFKGYYTHVELRKALSLGYKILKVHKCYYYLKTCKPFNYFVTDLYAKRKKYKKENSPMEKVIKITMNSLYGKFGEKFRDKDNILPFDHTVEELEKFDFWEFIDEKKQYIRIKNDRLPSPHCIPIWATYVTAYGRILLHDALVKTNAVYCDTDSLMTKTKCKNSLELGKLKLEMFIEKGLIVKPKFYAVTSNKEEIIKIKGIGTKINKKDFDNLVTGKHINKSKLVMKNLFYEDGTPMITYDKFMKVKESLRRGFIPNEIVQISKKLNLDDNKRIWKKKFNPKTLNSSIPKTMCIINNEIYEV